MAKVKPLIDAMKLLQGECKKHKVCETCPLQVRLQDDSLRACAMNHSQGSNPEDWAIEEVWEQNYG